MKPARPSALRVFITCLGREWKHQRYKFLVLTLAAVIFVAVLAYAGGSSLQIQEQMELPEYLKYKISLVSEEADSMVIRVLQGQLAEMPFLSEVYTEGAAEAKQRLEDGEILLSIEFPEDFIAAFQEGRETEPLHFSFNPAMPMESARLQAILKNWLKALNWMRSDIFLWQRLYEDYSADRSGSYLHMTFHAMRSVGTFGQRYRFVRLEEQNHFVGQGYFLAGTVLLFSLLPALIFFDSRGRELDSVFQDRLRQVGASGLHYVAKICMSFLLWAGLTFPVLYLAQRLAPRVHLDALAAYSVLIWLISLLLASAAAYLHFTPPMRTAVSWLGLLLSLFFAGSIYPLELFPKSLRKIAFYSPFYTLFEAILQEMSGAGGEWLKRENLSLLLSLIPALLLLLALKRRAEA